MPIYTYINDDTGEKIDIIQSMNDIHEYVDETGKKWRRVFYSPNASVDSVSNLDPFNTEAYVEKSGKTKGSMADLYDMSREASLKREQKIGAEDPVKRKYFDKYQQKNKVKHFYDRPTKIEKKEYTIDYSNSKKH